MLATIKVSEKKEFNDCVARFIGGEKINLSFKDADIFMDNLNESEIYDELLFQKVEGISSISLISESSKFPNGITIKLTTTHLKNALDMCKDEPFEIVIDDFYFEVNQGNTSYKSLIVEVGDFKTKKSHDKNEKANLIFPYEISSTLEIEMSEIIDAFRIIHESERYGKLPPFYNFNFSNERVFIEKGEPRYNCLSVTFDKYKFSGSPTKVKLMEGIEKIKDIFSHDSIVKIKCYDGKIIHISQKPSPRTTINFVMCGMSE